MPEDRLRAALVEGNWTLPDWAEVEPRLDRLRARQQRLKIASAVAAVAVLIAGVVLPLVTVPHGAGHAALRRIPNRLYNSDHRAPATLPAVGSPAFPDAIYPASDPVLDALPATCPNPAGVNATPPPLRLSAYRSLGRLHHDGDVLSQELARSDRSLWQRIAAAYTNLADVKSELPILTWTPVSVAPAVLSPAARVASRRCGPRLVAASTALLVKGPLGAEATFVLQRDGHLLMWTPAGPGGNLANSNPRQSGLIFGRGSIPRCAYPIRVRPTTDLTRVKLVERNRSHANQAIGQRQAFTCSLAAWPTLYLMTPDRLGDFPRHRGTARPLRLGPGQRAVTTLSGVSCHEEPALYSRVIDETSASSKPVTLTIAPCGIRETGWQRIR